jgi:hypothetical protein
MTMVTFTSCKKDNLCEKFNLETTFNEKNTAEQQMVENSLQELEYHYYLYGKYELKNITYLKTKIHIQTDSLILGENYVRGKNSFDGGTMNINMFIFLKNENGTYFIVMDDESVATLELRMGFENSQIEKNKILSKYVIKHGHLNRETDYENRMRGYKNDKFFKRTPKQIEFAKKYFEEKLDI